MIAERMEFFFKFVTQPNKIGSITPSSSYLTKKMMEDLPWQSMDTVVELGAGTGVFTRYIAERRHADCQVVIFEQSLEMRKELEQEFPQFHYGEKAQTVEHTLKLLRLPKADCIISGLPFSIFPEKLTKAILDGVVKSLSDDGTFVAFQYSPYMARMLDSYFSHIEREFVVLNMPPAFVYKCRK